MTSIPTRSQRTTPFARSFAFGSAWALLALTAQLALAPPAQAQSARELFEQALAEMKAGDFESACPKLERSLQADSQAGAVFALAECHAGWGKPATALKYYERYLALYPSLSEAQRQRHARSIERARLAVRDTKPPRLILRQPESTPPQAAWTGADLDADPLPAPFEGVPIPVDPGDHVVTAHFADGSQTSLRVTIDAGAADVEQFVSRATEPPAPPAAPPAALSAAPVAPVSGPVNVKDPSSAREVWGWTALGVGSAGFVFGSIMGINAIKEDNALEDSCFNTDACDTDKALRFANASTLGFGVALVGGIAAFVLLSGGDDTGPTRAGPSIEPLLMADTRGGWAGFGGSF